MLTKWENEGEGEDSTDRKLLLAGGPSAQSPKPPSYQFTLSQHQRLLWGLGSVLPGPGARVCPPAPGYGHLGLPAGHHLPASPVIGPGPGSPSNRPRSYYTPKDGLGT